MQHSEVQELNTHILYTPDSLAPSPNTTPFHLEQFRFLWKYICMIWTNHVRNEEVLLRCNEQMNILHEIRKRMANWIGHILRRNCPLKQVIEGKIKGQIEVTRRGGRIRKKLVDDLGDRRGYCNLKEKYLRLH
jgi:hypothetical protein